MDAIGVLVVELLEDDGSGIIGFVGAEEEEGTSSPSKSSISDDAGEGTRSLVAGPDSERV